MELQGKIIAVLDIRSGVSKTGNEWKTQSFVIETEDQYPKKMVFEVFGDDKITEFNIQAGEKMTVHFDIDARQWQDRWFNSVRAWKIERIQQQAQQPEQRYSSAPTASRPPAPESNNDDLPF